MHMRKQLIAVVVAIAAVMFTTAGPAHAHNRPNPHTLKLNTYTCDFAVTGECVTPTDDAFASWVTLPANGLDSPLDSNANAILVHTPGTDLAAYDYVEIYSDASLALNKPASQIKNLSFESRLSSLRGGSPRIVAFLSVPAVDGATWVAIDAGNCQAAISSTWVRADATGRTAAGCTIYTSSGTPYASDGVNSAWKNFSLANPGIVVTFTYLVLDIPTGGDALGDYRIDRIALGTGKVYTSSNAPVSCFYESSC